MEENWSFEDMQKAREWMLEAVLNVYHCSFVSPYEFFLQMTTYRTAIRLGEVQSQSQFLERLSCAQGLSNLSATAAAASSLLAGYGRLGNLDTSVRRSTRTVSPLTTPSGSPACTSLSLNSSTSAIGEQQMHREVEEDRRDARNELQRYEDAGLVSETTGHTADIVHYWEVIFHSSSAYSTRRC